MTVITNLKNYFKKILENKGKVIKVTVELYYVIDGETCWNNEDLKQDWFEKHSLGSYHAFRDNSKISGTENVLDVKFLNNDDLEQIKN